MTKEELNSIAPFVQLNRRNNEQSGKRIGLVSVNYVGTVRFAIGNRKCERQSYKCQIKVQIVLTFFVFSNWSN
jgi:hypothetical protein